MMVRLGTSLILLGVIVLVVFVMTLTIEQASLLTLFAGALLSATGLILRRRFAEPLPPRPERFRILKRLFRGRKKEG